MERFSLRRPSTNCATKRLVYKNGKLESEEILELCLYFRHLRQLEGHLDAKMAF